MNKQSLQFAGAAGGAFTIRRFSGLVFFCVWLRTIYVLSEDLSWRPRLSVFK